MTLERRIHLTTAIIVLLALILGGFLFLNSSGVRYGLDQMKTSSEIARMAFLMRTLMDEYLEGGDARPLTQWLKVNESLEKIIQDAKGGETVDRSLLKELEERYQDVNELHAQIVQLGVSENQDQQQKLLRTTLAGLMAVRLEELVDTAQRIRRSTQSKTLSRQNLAQLSIVGAFLVMVGLIVLNLYLMKRSILQPLRALAAAGVNSGADDVQRYDNMDVKAKTGGLTETFQMLVERIQRIQESLRMETTERAQAQDALRRLNEGLEMRVLDRTAELTKAQRELEQELQERYKAEQALKQSEERLRLAQSSANVGVWEWHLSSAKVFWTEEMERLYGYAEGTFPGTYQGFSERVHPNDLAEVERLYNEAVKASQPFDFDFRIQWPSGEMRWINCKGAAHYDKAGNAERMFGVNVDITDRKEIEQSLADSEEMFRSIYVTSAHGILITVPDGRVLRANRTAQEILGMNEHEILNAARHGIADLSDPSLALALEERKRTGRFTGELNYKRKDGTIFPAYVSSNVFTNSKGEVLSCIIFQDITERKQMEEALQGALADLAQSRRLLETILAQAPVGFVYFDRDLRYVLINERLAEMNGIPATAHIGKTIPEMVPALAPFVEEVVANILATGQPVKDREFSGETPAMPGILRYWNESWYPVCDDSGEIVGFGAVIEEITERKAAQEALRKSHEELELRVQERTAELEKTKEAIASERQRLYDVLETLPVYVCLLDSEYRTPFANRYFRESFGESQGRCCYDFLFNRTEPCENCESYTAMKTGRPHHWYWTGPNGRDYDIYDFPFTDSDGSMLVLEMGIDITERKRAEDELKQTLADLTRSNEDLQQFAYVASHDLQEPLRNVATALQMFEKRHKGKLDRESDQLIDYAVDAARKMKALVNDLLQYSRLTNKARDEEVRIQDVLDQAVGNLNSMIVEKGTEITYDQMPTVRGDPTRLLQVLQNLIGNAIKFGTCESPKVHVSAQSGQGEWIFSVRDNGIGIEPDQFDRIFVIFQQLNKQGSFDGTGMGLAIVKRIVESNGGRVWVESEVGVGSIFYFTVPDGTSA